ncbi:MAG: PIN domain-containing protein [Firmicutes bacterium]|nr:PIN domain-containing protein [Bacillota bacterium]
MRVYLDNCCFNRPFDDQSSLIIRLETEAKLHVQDLIRQGKLELVWSFMLDYENDANPFEELRSQIAEWKNFAAIDCDPSGEVSGKAKEIMELGLRPKDAVHIACAICLEADCFLTTDKKILNKSIAGIQTVNPVDFIRRYLDAD